jgi:CRP-like cAMP-binding protein
MSGSVAFSGNLDFLNLGELLQLLGSTSASGALHLTSKYAPEAALIYVDKGNPINAINGPKTGLDAIFSLFGWKEGRFEFVQEEVACNKSINKNRMEIILDGLRMLDEGKVEVIGQAQPTAQPTGKTIKLDSVPLIKGPLIDYSYVVDEEGFYDGDEIVQEGNHGNWIWVILEGVAEIVKSTPAGPLKILKIGDGAFLGSVAALLKGDNVRSATVTAFGNVQLGMLNAQLITTELANLSMEYRELIICLDSRLKQVTRMVSDLYCGDRKILNYVREKKTLIKQGQNEGRLFRIRSGEAYIARETDYGTVPLTRLREGQFLGNIPFWDLSHEPYSASVYASQDLKLVAADLDGLRKEHKKLPSTLKNILAHLATCISVTSLIACDHYKKSFIKAPSPVLA